MKYAFFEQHRQAFSIQRMCAFLGIARSGYYAWRLRGGEPYPCRRRQALIDRCLAQAFEQDKRRLGAPWLPRDLNDAGMAICLNTVAASLRRQNLRVKAACKFKATMNSRHSLFVAPNLLEQDSSASTLNRKWVGDTTYLATGEGWFYLAVLIDLYAHKMIGWAMSERMTADPPVGALPDGAMEPQDALGSPRA